jgi:hypothetical protein
VKPFVPVVLIAVVVTLTVTRKTPFSDLPDVLTVEEVGQDLGIGRNTAYTRICAICSWLARQASREGCRARPDLVDKSSRAEFA